MLMFLLKYAVCALVGWLIWDAGYTRGKHDLWDILSRGYIVLPKGSYYCHTVGKQATKVSKKEKSK